MKNLWARFMVTGLTITGLAAGATGIAYTATSSSSSDTTTQTSTTATSTTNQQSSEQKGFGDKGGRGGKQTIDTASFVTAGTIDQATADKITAYQEAQNTAREAEKTKMQAMTETERQAYFEANKSETKTDMFTDLVSQGILTQTQADTMKAAMPQRNNKNNIDTASLVTAGTIDQATADKITAYQEAQKTAREAEKTKMKAMTETERQAYFEANKSGTKTDMFADLVSQGILTQTQADAIKATMPQDGEKKHGKKNMDTASLVTAGTIDQATADKITAYQETQNTAREAEKTKMQAMTDTERQAYFEAKKSETKTDMFTDLVSQGILTQTQADAIKVTMPQRTKNSTDTAPTSTAANSSVETEPTETNYEVTPTANTAA